MTNSNYTKRVNKHNDQSRKIPEAVVPSRKLGVEAVVRLLPPGYKDIYNDRSEIQNYNQPGSLFYGMSEKQVLDSIVNKAMELGLDPSVKKTFRIGSDIYKHWKDSRIKSGQGNEDTSEADAGTDNSSVEIEKYVHPLIKEHIEQLENEGAVFAFLNSTKTSLIISHPEYRAIFRRTLKIHSDEEGESETIDVVDSDFEILAYFDNLRIYQPIVPGRARKVEFDAISEINSAIHIGPATSKDAVNALEQQGLVMDKTHALDVFSKAIAAYIESGKAEQLTGKDTPGFFWHPSEGKVQVVGYELRDVTPEEIAQSLITLDRISSLFDKSLSRFSSVVKHSLSAPFSYVLRQMKLYPQHILLYGLTSTSKTALLLINHGIWGIWDLETHNHGFFISGAEADTPSRIGERLEQGTFTLVIDEGEGLFLKSDGRENVQVIGILKHALQSTVSRQTSDRGVFQALASVAIATNVKPPRGAAPILSRMATFESGSSEQIRISIKEKEKFQKLQNEIYPKLGAIGQFVASRVVKDPSILTVDFESFGETMLTEMYHYAGLKVPEWVIKRAEPTTVEDMDRDIKEEIRTFLYRTNLDAYAKNIGRTGILRTGPNGNDYPDYDEKTNVSALEKIETSIKSGLIPWQIFKNTKGLEQVILTTAFAKEASKIAGEAFNLQSIGELLGFEAKFVRTGKNTAWAIVANLNEYLKFLVPDVATESADSESKVREDLRALKTGNTLKKEPVSLDEHNPAEMSENLPGHSKVPHEDEPAAADLNHKKQEKTEPTMDPVLKLLIDCTYNSTKKYKTVTEIWSSSPDSSLEKKTVYDSLERLVKEGLVVKNGLSYASKDILEGRA
jgi:hypothetical protein